MSRYLDRRVVWALAQRTFRHSVESPIAYVVGLFFYGFVGGIFALNFFVNNEATTSAIGMVAPWVLWFVIPALTMGLISDELRSGTFEQLSTLPVRDWEIVLGKFLGFAMLTAILIGGLAFFSILVSFLSPQRLDWGGNLGVLVGLYLFSLSYGAMGLFASSLAKNQVVCLILGMIFCTAFFFIGQFYSVFSGTAARVADSLGITSHLDTMGRGVWDVRDLVYFLSLITFFLYLSVQRLLTRRF